MTRRRSDPVARRGGVVTVGVSRPELPFDVPSRATLRASARKVFPHYFATVPGPLRVTDTAPGTPDYYDSFWMPPGALEFVGATDYRPVGGLVRDRPAIRNAAGGTGFERVDRRIDVQDAVDAGCDGFVDEILGLSGANYDRAIGIYDAVAELGLVGQFDVWPMFDMTGLSSFTAAQLANATAIFAAKPAAYKINGRVQVAWFAPEVMPLQFYVDYRAACAAQAIQVDNTFCYVGALAASNTAVVLNSEAARHGLWGSRNPVDSGGPGTQARGAAQYIRDSYGKPYMGYVAPGDVRANVKAGNNYNEQRGLEQLRVSWDSVIFGNGTAAGQADITQIPTWNDYGETANVAPSLLHGWSVLDVGLYYLTRYKTGSYPVIARDCLYLAHRSQFTTGMTYTASTFNNPLERTGSQTEVDEIDLTVFATAPATVYITRGTGGSATTSSYPVPAGVSAVKASLLAGPAGSVSARMSRDGGVTTVPGTGITSPWAVSHTGLVHDPAYRIGSSLRGWSATYPSPVPAQSQAIT